MAQKFLSGIDLAQTQLLNARIQNLSAAPSSPVAGQIYFDTTTNILYFYSGTEWVAATGGAASSLNGYTASQLLDRTNHTGTQLASTISNLATTVKSYRLDEFASPTTNLSLNSQRITNLADPTSSQDAATKAYVDATRQGLDVKDSARVATTANISLTGTQTIDGVAVNANDRVLVKNQTTASQNGIYTASAGAWTRAGDADTSAKVTPGMFVFVEEGTTQADSGWVLTTDSTITLGTTNLSFAQFSGAGQVIAGTGLLKSGNTLSLDTASGYGIRKYATTIGDGSTTSFTVTHNFNTQDVDVTARYASGTFEVIGVDWAPATVNTVTVSFTNAPTTNQFRIVVWG